MQHDQLLWQMSVEVEQHVDVDLYAKGGRTTKPSAATWLLIVNASESILS